ncbi:undecaprenyl-diphosphate phosphatase [Enterobacillus tribolii]|uniref:undecaprenyl-diphosphate phosphatase n=1 Tax=Enterobacillus tribolii TaxID=1487935 RepID=A0A370QM65_9GAMM|nr:undecaprenyl-diphosphate phosphatase [Enterobacillus tribolii]MBW7982289.1 undecaprenyl-diphosphate phosphatase [Enterobacillus tribolii]RDK89459.1 undecaprenyl-diphosphatase [Enterobacillus tribolii]
MEHFNHLIFLLINATPASPAWAIAIARFLANDLIAIVPLLIVILWLWSPQRAVEENRQLIIRGVMALAYAMLSSKVIGILYPHARPFVEGIGYSFIPHAPDASFPSDHGTAIFTFALAFLFWYPRRWAGVTLLISGVAIAWSRVYLGVHWPMDMVGALLVALLGCLTSQLIWELWGSVLQTQLLRLYRFSFAFPIRKGWVKP